MNFLKKIVFILFIQYLSLKLFFYLLKKGLLKESKAECETAVRLSDSLAIQLTDTRLSMENEVNKNISKKLKLFCLKIFRLMFNSIIPTSFIYLFNEL